MNNKITQVKVHIDEALRYMGAGQTKPTAQIIRAAELVEEACRPRFTYRVFDLDPVSEEGRISCRDGSSGTFELPGKDIAGLLRDSGRCIIMAATIGGEVDRLIRRLSVKDMADAVIADACASSAIEDLCNSISGMFRRKAADSGLFLTDRFSPGYGDMDISFQRRIADLLQTQKRIGLTVSDSCMMTPMKSVTAVIGIADRPQPKMISGCGNCDMRDRCTYRKTGTTCGS